MRSEEGRKRVVAEAESPGPGSHARKHALLWRAAQSSTRSPYSTPVRSALGYSRSEQTKKHDLSHVGSWLTEILVHETRPVTEGGMTCSGASSRLF